MSDLVKLYQYLSDMAKWGQVCLVLSDVDKFCLVGLMWMKVLFWFGLIWSKVDKLGLFRSDVENVCLIWKDL